MLHSSNTLSDYVSQITSSIPFRFRRFCNLPVIDSSKNSKEHIPFAYSKQDPTLTSSNSSSKFDSTTMLPQFPSQNTGSDSDSSSSDSRCEPVTDLTNVLIPLDVPNVQNIYPDLPNQHHEACSIQDSYSNKLSIPQDHISSPVPIPQDHISSQVPALSIFDSCFVHDFVHDCIVSKHCNRCPQCDKIQFDAFAPTLRNYGGSTILHDPGGYSTMILDLGFTSTFSTRGMGAVSCKSLFECPFHLSSTTSASTTII